MIAMICQKCKGKNLIKIGKEYTLKGNTYQCYQCNKCDRKVKKVLYGFSEYRATNRMKVIIAQ